MTTERVNPDVPNEGELFLTGGGPVLRLLRRAGMFWAGTFSMGPRIIGILSITWLPMCLLAALQGLAIGPTPRDSFLLDFATYARFFVSVPLLIIAEAVIGRQLMHAGRAFLHDGFIRREDYPAFQNAIARLSRRRESAWVALVLVALALLSSWMFTAETRHGNIVGWRSVILSGSHAFPYSLAALWSRLVAVPIVMFLWYRWVWRIFIWTAFLRAVSRLKLQLVPTHADQAGGLGFLGVAHASFGILAFAATCVPSAEVAFRIVYEGDHLPAYKGPLLLLLVGAEVLFLAPLLLFTPILVAVRRAGLWGYGLLVVQYNRAFHNKWAEGSPPEDEPLLGSADIQSLADLGNSFRFVKEMRLVPFGTRTIIELAAATAFPVLLLFPLVMPMREIVEALAKVAF